MTGHDGRARTPAAPQGFLIFETHSLDPLGNETVSRSYLDRSSHTTTQTTLSPNSALPAETVARCGLTISSRSPTGVTTTYAYDPLGRQISQTDGRGNTSQIVYDAQGRVAKTIDALGHETTYAYDALGRQTAVTDPLGHTITTTYDAEGRVLAQRGATYPVDYAYDAYGNKVSMTTYRDEALTNGDTTRWLYDEPSGCMTNKLYADGKGPSYSYTPDGKLSRRVWARGIATDYTYDNAGQLVSTSYSDDTPTITMSYDRVGNLIEATTVGVVTNLYAYDLVGNCTNEWQNDFNLTRYYDTLGRTTGYAINGTRQTTIAYDSVGRISTMHVPTIEERENVHSTPTPTNYTSFQWTYLQGSGLKSSLSYPNGLTASWAYDANNQLLQVKNTYPSDGLGRDSSPLPSAGVISQFDYTYDAAGRRTAIAKSGSAFGDLSGSIDSYTYNARSELTSARRTKNGQPIPGFSEDFDYDPIGNRRSSATYNEKGEAQTSTYQANNLNQYTSRTTPGYAAVRGEADPSATVTVNENPTFRLGSYYFGSDLFDNTTAGGLANLETYATLARTAANGDETDDLISSETNQVYLAQSPETFDYDDDGNQTLITTKTGLWRVTYNGENRPVLWVRDSDNTTLTMSYDHMGRRREKNDQRFFYDGYLQVADNNGNAYAWDCTEPVATRPLAWSCGDLFEYYTHDGNKNVSEVITMNDGLVAHYEYAPFGAIIALCGERVGANPWRFSSEFAEDEMGLVLFNYRHYNEYEGEWLTRDQMNEYGGLNLYAAQGNDVVNDFDLLGEITAGQIVDNFLRPNNFIPVLWVMPQYDEYTLSVRRWKYVKKQESEIKKSVSNNPMRWKALHITSATWTPHTGYGFDPKKGYECLVAHPDGTDPNTARNEYMKYLVFGGWSDKLNWAAIGSFRVAATADYVDMQNCEAQINVWMYNEMSRRSFGRFAERWYFRWLPMASQYMWWNWSLKIKFNGKGEYYDLQTSDAAW